MAPARAARRAGGSYTPPHGRGAHRGVGLAVCPVARALLPARAAAAPGARAHRCDLPHRRAQRLLLLLAAARVLRPLAGQCPARVHVRGQGRTLHHPRQAAARRHHPARQLPRLRCARPGGPAGSAAVAAARTTAARPRPHRRVPRAAPDDDHRRGRARRRPRRAPRRVGMDHDRRRPHAAARAGGAPPELRRPGVPRPPARARRRPRRLRRRGDVAAVRGADRASRLRPPTRRGRALRQRLRHRRAARVGRRGAALARCRARRRGLLRQRRQGTGAVRRARAHRTAGRPRPPTGGRCPRPRRSGTVDGGMRRAPPTAPDGARPPTGRRMGP